MLKQQCALYNLPYYDTSYHREDTLDALIADIFMEWYAGIIIGTNPKSLASNGFRRFNPKLAACQQGEIFVKEVKNSVRRLLLHL